MKRISNFLIIFLISQQVLFAQGEKQTELSLEKCIKMAVERNINTQAARIEQEKSEYKISESRAALLPKVNASASFQDYFKLPTTLLPGEIVGMPGTKLPAEMGTTFNTNIAATLNMTLYNQTAITALQLSKKLAGLSGLTVEKASEEIALEVAYIILQ
ncbi:MAG: TolC family protein [Bacteroidales bacterium]|jgi:outer membrane protein TolC|nr:TolC family protein [Bacteroidales bacterium]